MHIPIGSTGEFTHILVSAISYNFKEDNRLLIPFSIMERIGFVNKDADVIIQPKYTMYYGDFIYESDHVVVTKFHLYGKARRDGSATVWKRPVYGLIDIKGNETLKLEYYHISAPYKCTLEPKLFVVQNMENKWGIVDAHGYEFVPFGKYDKIEGFAHNYAKVCKDGKWNITDSLCKELYPTSWFSYISNLYDDSDSIRVRNSDGTTTEFSYDDLYERTKFIELGPEEELFDPSDYDGSDNGCYYDEFSGSYAHDVMGYDDGLINDAFDGDPDAYWNID